MSSRSVTLIAALGINARRWRRVMAMFWRHAVGHRLAFWMGCGFSLLVVLTRLAVPWLFHAMIAPWLAAYGKGEPLFFGTATMAWWGIAILGLLAVLGFADYRERLSFAQFVIAAVRDLRRSLFHKCLHARDAIPSSGAGELVSRLIGDTARVKEGAKGFLVHVVPNGMLFVGVMAVVGWINLPLGLIFAAAGMAIAAVTIVGASLIFDRALRNRTKEGELALSISHTLAGSTSQRSLDRANDKSGDHEAAVTRLQGRTTWMVHVLYGAMVVAALFVGSSVLSRQALSPRDVVVLLLYVLMLRAPVVQLSRQGARTGKILAAGWRLHELEDEPPSAAVIVPTLTPLSEGISLRGVFVRSSPARQKKYRLRWLSLDIRAGEHLLIVAPSQAGKSSLLAVLAGHLPLDRGEIVYDNVTLSGSQSAALANISASYDPQQEWPEQKLAGVLNIVGRETAPEVSAILNGCGVDRIASRLRKGLRTRVTPTSFTHREIRQIALARALLSDHQLILLDEPLTRSKRRTLPALLAAVRGKTLVYASREPLAVEHFSRVIYLDHGAVVTTAPQETSSPP